MSALFSCRSSLVFVFFDDMSTSVFYTLSLHDALPICSTPSAHRGRRGGRGRGTRRGARARRGRRRRRRPARSEEHTSELQSLTNLVCRLLLEKKKTFSIPNGESMRASTSPEVES